MSDNFKVTENSSLHHYRTEIPNIIWELGLDPYAMTLYLYLKKVAGDSGACFQSNATIAEKTKMSVDTVKRRRSMLAESFPELDNQPLITVTERKKENGENETTLITINDIWGTNFKKVLGGAVSTEGGCRESHKEEPLNKHVCEGQGQTEIATEEKDKREKFLEQVKGRVPDKVVSHSILERFILYCSYETSYSIFTAIDKTLFSKRTQNPTGKLIRAYQNHGITIKGCT